MPQTAQRCINVQTTRNGVSAKCWPSAIAYCRRCEKIARLTATGEYLMAQLQETRAELKSERE
ncbi:hypothetical protein HLB02_19540 [Serratia nevei]|nr:hypothetical protein [Serratia nevei]